MKAVEKDNSSEPAVIVIMGVAGSGKSTVGKLIAERMRMSFADGDDFHSPENKAKMTSGTPLTDIDRVPWLATLQSQIKSWLANASPHVLACSALKKSYRDELRNGDQRVHFVYLKAPPELVEARLLARANHYMKADMVASQFAALNEPSSHEAIVVDASLPPDVIVEKVTKALGCTSASF